MASTKSYARAATETLRELKTEIYKLDPELLKSAKELIKREKDAGVRITPPKEFEDNIEKKTVTFRTMSLITKKIEEISDERMSQIMEVFNKEMNFFKKGRRFGTVEVRFETEEQAMKRATESLESYEYLLLPTYCGKRVVRVRVGRIEPEYPIEWVVCAITEGLEDVTILKTTRTETINNWGFGVEVLLQVSLEEQRRIADEILLPNEGRLRIIVQGRPATCFKCRKVGHLQARCPLNQQEEEEEDEEEEESEKEENEKEGEEKEKEKEKEEEMGGETGSQEAEGGKQEGKTKKKKKKKRNSNAEQRELQEAAEMSEIVEKEGEGSKRKRNTSPQGENEHKKNRKEDEQDTESKGKMEEKANGPYLGCLMGIKRGTVLEQDVIQMAEESPHAALVVHKIESTKIRYAIIYHRVCEAMKRKEKSEEIVDTKRTIKYTQLPKEINEEKLRNLMS